MNNIHLFFAVLILSFLSTLVLTKFLIPIIISKKVGQHILADGPSWHKNKEGTPTMGGLSFVFTIIGLFLIYLLISHKSALYKENICALNVIIYSLLNACIGIIDDLSKIIKKENKGLSAKSKFLLQSVSAIIFLVLMKATVGIDTSIQIPFLDFGIELGIFYYIFAFILLCGFVNAVNLTDGIDGLATSLTVTVAVLFSIISFTKIQNSAFTFISAALLGSMVAFLIFNFHPAKIFMGDTGSLFLGALIVGTSFLINNILVFLYGVIYLIEAISVMVQVLFFKVTKGKRLLKMAPLHHHFEKSGWSENKIVLCFTIINAIFCLLAFLGM